MKTAILVLAILFFATVSWGVDKKGVATKGQKGVLKSQETEEKEIKVKTTEQKAKRVMTKIDNARAKRLKR